MGYSRCQHSRPGKLRIFWTTFEKKWEQAPAIASARFYVVCGPDRFRRAIEAQLGRTVGPKKIGRPRKQAPGTPAVLENRL